MNLSVSSKTVLVASAAAFAYKAHAQQVRKYSNLPYFTHCYDVAKLVETVSDSGAGLAAAFLHDVLEDTETKAEELRGLFGTRVLNLVLELTDHYTAKTHPQYNRATRKMCEARRLGETSALAQTIKVADVIDNTSSIVMNDPDFARIYLGEKELYLQNLSKANKHLRILAVQLLEQSRQKLGV